METKTKKVALHLIKYKKITSWDAITKYKATRLSAIIFNLKKKLCCCSLDSKIIFGIFVANGFHHISYEIHVVGQLSFFDFFTQNIAQDTSKIFMPWKRKKTS